MCKYAKRKFDEGVEYVRLSPPAQLLAATAAVTSTGAVAFVSGGTAFTTYLTTYFTSYLSRAFWSWIASSVFSFVDGVFSVRTSVASFARRFWRAARRTEENIPLVSSSDDDLESSRDSSLNVSIFNV
jgi:hypothetical protein